MTLRKSQHNVVSPIPGTGDWLIANPLSGNADRLSAKEYAAYREEEYGDVEEWRERGYLVEAAAEAGK